MTNTKSDQTSQSGDNAQPQVHMSLNSNYTRKRYLFGAQGNTLLAQVAIAGSIGFLLFGYDQGVLGVRQQYQTE